MKKDVIAAVAIVFVVTLACLLVAVIPSCELFHDRFFPDKTIEETGNCGEDAVWMFNKSKGELVISGKGCFGSSGEFSGCTVIRSVVIEDGISEIGKNAFSGCSYLKSVSLPDSLQKIESSAFENCGRLKEIRIPKNVTEIDESFLSYCNLTSICVDPENSHYTSDESGVLYNKDKTVLIQYPTGKNQQEYTVPDSTQTINENAFFGCKALKRLVLGKNVRSIGSYAFSGCINLENLTLPASVEKIGEGVLFLSSKAEIYYAGTKEQWDKIEKEYETELAGIRIHCNRTDR